MVGIDVDIDPRPTGDLGGKGMRSPGVMPRDSPLDDGKILRKVAKQGRDLGTQIFEQHHRNPFVTQTLWILPKVTATVDHVLEVTIGLSQIVRRTREPDNSAKPLFKDWRFQTQDLELASSTAVQNLDRRGVNITEMLKPPST
jgi:hypothetical protein